jgi:hypothetical protein
MHPSASLLVVLGLANIALAVAIALVVGYARAARVERVPPSSARGFALGVAAWVVLIGVVSAAGLLRGGGARPPPVGVLVMMGLALAVAVARSRLGARLARGLPLAALVGFQAFRLPLELVMHRAASEGTMPVQMSFSGYNFDIVSGASALIVAWLVARGAAPRWLVAAWAVTSSALLAAIVVIAIVSTPLFAAFGHAPERLNTWIEWFPFAWLPALLVPAALLGQIVVFRRLAADRVTSRAELRDPSRA